MSAKQEAKCRTVTEALELTKADIMHMRSGRVGHRDLDLLYSTEMG